MTGKGPRIVATVLVLGSSVMASGQSLRANADRVGLAIGTALAADPLRNESIYGTVAAREFNIVVAENAMKMGPLRPSRTTFFWNDADAIVAFAQANGMRVRGHTLVWHNQLPSWLTNGSFTYDEMVQILHDHIFAVVGRYRGQVMAWDVVNEALGDDNALRTNSIWYQSIGPDYIDMAFRWAHEADPDALLFYNDYGNELPGPRSDAVYALVQGMIQRGVPINGVGLQMHTSIAWWLSPESLAANIARFGALGLQVHITEMDVRIEDSAGDLQGRLDQQASRYRDVLEVCLASHGVCRALLTWGFTDKYSWLPGFTGHPDEAGLIFDKSYDPKPAYSALSDTLALARRSPRRSRGERRVGPE